MPGDEPLKLACFRTVFSAALPNGVEGASPEGGFGRDARVAPSLGPPEGLRSDRLVVYPLGVARRRTTDAFYRSLVRGTRRQLRLDPCQSPAAIARKLACSERTLNRAFAANGGTVREERDRVRLDRAALVLLAGKPSAEAARSAGYVSARQLADPLRRRFGVTPSRMRRIGGAVRTVTWQARRLGPYRGSWQQRERNAVWRAERRVLREALQELVIGTMPARRVARALELRLPRPRELRAPLKLYEAFGPAARFVPEDLLRRHFGSNQWRGRRRRSGVS
jgi:AraC-like DNA-binding protein